jgi:hypothetical protein
MAGNFPTMPDIQITENGVAKLLKIQKGYIKFNYVVCLSDTCSSCHVTVMGSLIVLGKWLVFKFHGSGHLPNHTTSK